MELKEFKKVNMGRDYWEDISYFVPNEFACLCGCNLTGRAMSRAFIEKLNMARAKAGIPFVITSGIRCRRYNKEIGGVDTSLHLVGNAVDIACPGSLTRFVIVSALISAGINKIGLYNSFVHASIGVSNQVGRIWFFKQGEKLGSSSQRLRGRLSAKPRIPHICGDKPSKSEIPA